MLQNLYIKTFDDHFHGVSIDSEATIGTIQDGIDGLASSEGQNMLILNGRILDDKQTLSQCNIMNDAILEVTYRCFGGKQIFVKTFSGQTVTLQVDGHSTVSTLKNAINAELGYPPQSQRLMYGAKQLEDGYTLDQYNIPADAAIYVVGRLLGGH